MKQKLQKYFQFSKNGAFHRNFRWFLPGLGVKRWLLVILGGTTFIGIGIGILVLDVYRSSPDTWWLPIMSYASLRILSRPLRVIIFGGIGFGLLLGGIWGLNRALVIPFRKPGQPIVDIISTHRRKERGPKIVVIGGGHGLAMLLRGLKAFSHRLIAVVTVADDGGSSGRLRKSMGIIPPGDLRNCLAALSDDETMITQLFQYRFADGDGELNGHSFGNLFLTALSEITGSFEEALAESGKVLAINGRVLPSCLDDINLVGELNSPETEESIVVEGESKISTMKGVIKRVWLKPTNPRANPEVIAAILSADLIVLGPGSLYTSILPNVLIPDIAAALKTSQGLKMYVCNVATQPGETDYFSCEDHLEAIRTHGGMDLLDLVIINNNFSGKLLKDMQWVEIDDYLHLNYPIYEANLIDETEPWHHDSMKLASVIIDLFQDKTGPLTDNN